MIKRPLNPRFSPKVLSGIKTTTIRGKAWPIDTPIMLYNWSGLPYRSRHLDVAEVIVTHIDPIEIARYPEHCFYTIRKLGGRHLWEMEGFDSHEDMDQWFASKLRIGQRLNSHLMHFQLLKSRKS